MKEKEPDKIEVHKIDIKIGDKTISLKPEQLRELKKLLNEMFEDGEVKVIREDHYHHHQYHPPYQPIYIQPYWHQPSLPYPNWTIYCGTGTSTSGSSYTMNTATLSLNAA